MKVVKTNQISKELINMDDIKKRIFTLRGLQVMLDKDLAVLYGVKPIRLREQVKRNIKRFPKDFMFQLTDEEIGYMLSQNAIPSKKYLGGARPLVFTEQGVASISSILNSERATHGSSHTAHGVFNSSVPVTSVPVTSVLFFPSLR